MIPFNLERAKQGVPMNTRKGHKAKFIAHLDGGQPAPILIEVDGYELENYYLNGKHNYVHDSEYDLFMKY
jgi:hypothetical protein